MRRRIDRQRRKRRRNRPRRAVVRPVSRLWRYGTVPYLIDQSIGKNWTIYNINSIKCFYPCSNAQFPNYIHSFISRKHIVIIITHHTTTYVRRKTIIAKCFFLLLGRKTRRHIQEAIRHYEENTCIKFVPRTNQKDYIVYVYQPGYA